MIFIPSTCARGIQALRLQERLSRERRKRGAGRRSHSIADDEEFTSERRTRRSAWQATRLYCSDRLELATIESGVWLGEQEGLGLNAHQSNSNSGLPTPAPG